MNQSGSFLTILKIELHCIVSNKINLYLKYKIREVAQEEFEEAVLTGTEEDLAM